MNRSIWAKHGNLLGTTTEGQRWPGINDNEGVLHTSKTRIMEPHHQMKSLVSYPGDLLRDGGFPLYRDTIEVFYSPFGHRAFKFLKKPQIRPIGKIECSPMAQKAEVQSQVKSYQRLKNGTWCLHI